MRGWAHAAEARWRAESRFSPDPRETCSTRQGLPVITLSHVSCQSSRSFVLLHLPGPSSLSLFLSQHGTMARRVLCGELPEHHRPGFRGGVVQHQPLPRECELAPLRPLHTFPREAGHGACRHRRRLDGGSPVCSPELELIRPHLHAPRSVPPDLPGKAPRGMGLADRHGTGSTGARHPHQALG